MMSVRKDTNEESRMLRSHLRTGAVIMAVFTLFACVVMRDLSDEMHRPSVTRSMLGVVGFLWVVQLWGTAGGGRALRGLISQTALLALIGIVLPGWLTLWMSWKAAGDIGMSVGMLLLLVAAALATIVRRHFGDEDIEWSTRFDQTTGHYDFGSLPARSRTATRSRVGLLLARLGPVTIGVLSVVFSKIFLSMDSLGLMALVAVVLPLWTAMLAWLWKDIVILCRLLRWQRQSGRIALSRMRMP